MSNEVTAFSGDAHNKRMTIHIPDNRPHWQRYGTSPAFVELTVYPAMPPKGRTEPTLAIHTIETGAKSTKHTMIDLDRAGILALRAACDYALGEPGPAVWLRDVDGSGSYHPCAEDDPGAALFHPVRL